MRSYSGIYNSFLFLMIPCTTFTWEISPCSNLAPWGKSVKSYTEEAQSSREKTPLVEMYIQYCINAVITSQLLVIWPLPNNSFSFMGILNNSPSDLCWPQRKAQPWWGYRTTGIKTSPGWQGWLQTPHLQQHGASYLPLLKQKGALFDWTARTCSQVVNIFFS